MKLRNCLPFAGLYLEVIKWGMGSMIFDTSGQVFVLKTATRERGLKLNDVIQGGYRVQ